MGGTCSKPHHSSSEPSRITGDGATTSASQSPSSSSSRSKRRQQQKQKQPQQQQQAHHPQPQSPRQQERQKRHYMASFQRVGSRRAPNSPARASNYGHVHDAVSHNFSAIMRMTGDGSSGGMNGGGSDSSSLGFYPLGVVGLRNLGNTCFLNSSLQCLSATIPLTDYFLGYDYRKELNTNNPLGTGGKLAISYAELMKTMWLEAGGMARRIQQQQNSGKTKRTRSNNHDNVEANVVKPTSFKAALEKFAPRFAGYHQHDAQELLALLLDGIHEDLNRIRSKPYIEDPDFDGTNDERDAATAWKNYLQRDKSLIVDLFQGQVKNTRQCCFCRHVNVKFEPFMYLSVPISDKCRSLNDCLNLYLHEERLRGDNQWYCAKCRKHRDAIQKTTLWILPPILIVHLKRFKFNDFGQMGSKNTAPIDYPFSWDLTRYVQCHGGDSVYDLYAVSNHVGGMKSGHYTAFGKNRFDDAWYEFNDSTCKKVSERTLQQNRASAYVLFYNRVEPEHRQQQQQQGLNGYGGGSSSPGLHRAPMIRRQSLSRPDLWPHAQVHDNQFREFTRQSIIRGAASSSSQAASYSESSSPPHAPPPPPPLYTSTIAILPPDGSTNVNSNNKKRIGEDRGRTGVGGGGGGGVEFEDDGGRNAFEL